MLVFNIHVIPAGRSKITSASPLFGRPAGAAGRALFVSGCRQLALLHIFHPPKVGGGGGYRQPKKKWLKNELRKIHFWVLFSARSILQLSSFDPPELSTLFDYPIWKIRFFKKTSFFATPHHRKFSGFARHVWSSNFGRKSLLFEPILPKKIRKI